MKSLLFLIIVSALLISSNIYAGGFQLNIRGAKAVAMGGAFTAVANDPSAVYWNAAGLTQLKGTNIMFSTHLIAPQSSFRGVAPNIDRYRAENRIFFPTHLFISHTFNEKMAVGIGFTQPFGLGSTWDDNWPGRYLSVETTLRLYSLFPVFNYQPIDEISLSAGVTYNFGNVLIKSKSQLPTYLAGYEAFLNLEGDDMFAYGFNGGLLIKPFKGFSIGVAYHSEVNYKFEGTATIIEAPEAALGSVPNGNIEAEITTPQNIAAGISVDVSEKIKLSTEFQYVGWSVYEKLEVVFIDYNPVVVSSNLRNYDDSYILRLGGSYKANDQLTFLAGVYYDKSPVESKYETPSIIETNRLGLSFGIDAQLFEKVSIQGSYLFIRGEQLTVNDSEQIYILPNKTFNGTYNASANIFSLSLNYHL